MDWSWLERLSTLQKTLAGAGAAIATVGAIVLAARRWLAAWLLAGTDELRMKRITIVDEMGRPRAVLRMDSDGAPTLEFQDPIGNVLGRVRVQGDGGADLAFCDRAGRPRATLRVEAGGTSSLEFTDLSGTPRLVLRVLPSGSSVVSLADAQGRGRVDLRAYPDGSPLLLLSDEHTRSLFSAPSRSPEPGHRPTHAETG